MPDYTLHTWIARQLRVRQRLQQVCASYLLFLMVVTTKHTLEEAARFSGLHKSQFSNLLKYHPNIAVYTLESLSKQQAKRLAKSLQPLKSLPWRIVLIIGTRSGCENLTLAIPSASSVPYVYGYAPLNTTGPLGTNAARGARLYWNA